MINELTDSSVPLHLTAVSGDPGALSEGPRWDGEKQELLWVDVLGRRLHRATVGPDGGLDRIMSMSFACDVGAAAPTVFGGWVLAAGVGFLYVSPDGNIQELAQPEAGRGDVRMNDGACDPQGRFWAGTMAYDESPGEGALYRLELDGACTKVLGGLSISNGIGWSPDGRTMYLADSGTRRIDAFDFSPTDGSIDGRRTVVQIADSKAAPDGLTVDDEGCIWVALWDGGEVRRYDAGGRLLATVPLPVDRPTSCAFGGPDQATLFVTTARVGLSPSALQRQPEAGRLFAIRGLNVTGPSCAPYRGRIEARGAI